MKYKIKYIPKIHLIIFFITVIVSIISCTAAAEETDSIADNETYIETAGILSEYISFYSDKIEDSAYNLDELSEVIPDFSVSELMEDAVNGGLDFSIDKIFKRMLYLLVKEIQSSFKLMVLVTALSVFCSYTVNLGDISGIGSSVSKTAFYVCYMIICGISSAAFWEVICFGRTAIDNMSIFMQTIIPLILMTLVSCGALISASVFEPVLISTITVSVMLIKTFFIPLLVTSTALQMVNNLSDRPKASGLISLINKTIKWGLGICLTVFVGIAGLQGIASGTVSGMGIKVSKFAASNLIPVVGGILSDSVEAVMNCSLVIKNSLGVVGIAVLVLIVVIPLIKLGASILVFRITAAVSEPVSDSKIVKCVTGFADSLTVMFSMVASISVMFIIILTIVINAGNMAVIFGR